MTGPSAAGAAADVGRLGTAAAWVAAASCVPYLFLKVVWTLGVPVGITDPSVLDSGEWVAGNAVMALLQLAGLLLVLALTRPWARRLPAWFVLFPVWVGAGLLFHVAVGAVLMALFAPPSETSAGSDEAIQGWVFAVVYASFALEGVALAIAFACYVRVRWRRLLGEHTGEVVARATAPGRPWPDRHLPVLAQVVAAMVVAVGLVCLYWAAGGEAGLSDAQPHPSWPFQAARVVGSVTAVVGLLGVAGRWGRRAPVWVPVGLVWIGSGALAAFDGLALVMNQVFALFGADASSGWAPADSVVVAKVGVGLLAAWVGVLVLRAAAQGGETPSARPEEARELTPSAGYGAGLR